jgi:hypothetical protein
VSDAVKELPMHETPASLFERLRQPNDRAAWDGLVELDA